MILPNPESAWRRSDALDTIDRAEVEARIGSTLEPLELLGGGLANLNVRIGADRVLRIFRRDPAAAGVEATLLGRGWRCLRVPRVLDRGDDWILLEHVDHAPVPAGAAQGAAVGRALAEIHAVPFATAGLFDASLALRHRFDDLTAALRDHLVEELAAAAFVDLGLQRAVVETFDHRVGGTRSPPAVLLHGDFKPANLGWTPGGDLLVLDWEFAYAGAALLDVGQLCRWHPPPEFCRAFATSYRAHGGSLSDDWHRDAEAYDLVNLAGLLARAAPGSQRAADVVARLRATVGQLAPGG